jgi:hypothetical protein
MKTKTLSFSTKWLKTLIVFSVASLTTTLSFAQTNTIPTTGNVGIGTLTPSAMLDVNGRMVVDSMVIIKDSLRVQKRLIVDQDIKVKGEAVFVGDGKFKNKLTINGLTKMNGDAKVFGNFKIKSLEDLNISNDRFLALRPNGKVKTLDTEELFKLIYQPVEQCVQLPNGKLITGWLQNTAFSYGVLYTTDICPVRVGIGTDNPITNLDVRGKIAMSAGAVNGFIPVSNASGIMTWTDPATIGTGSVWSTNTTTGGNDIFYSAGNVSIGTTKVTDGQTDFMLSVAGDMRAESMEVSLESTWPDYVFDKDYSLKTLTEVEKFITKNKHLPNVPSASDVEDNGINLGEMDAILLQKIEELTLYVIEQQKRIEELEKQAQKNK